MKPEAIEPTPEESVIAAAVEWVRSDMATSSYLERCNAHYNLRRTVREMRRANGEVVPDAFG